MSHLQRISNAVVGSNAGIKQLGWLGDSITIANYLGPTGSGTDNQQLGFAAIVSSYYGAFMNNQAESGRTLSSFLPKLTEAVGTATAEFDGQWLQDGSNWYWWDDRDGGSWVSVTDSGTSVNRVATSESKLTALTGNAACNHIIIAHSGLNDNQAMIDAGAGDAGANGSYHYKLLLSELIKRIKDAAKIPIVVTGTSAADPTFHGTTANLRQEQIGRYSEAARQACLTSDVTCCDVGLRLNLEIALGRPDILCRNSQVRPTDNPLYDTQAKWDVYLASTTDASAATNPYRVFDESEDDLHIGNEATSSRSGFWHNVHLNQDGHRYAANEIIKTLNEVGLV